MHHKSHVDIFLSCIISFLRTKWTSAITHFFIYEIFNVLTLTFFSQLQLYTFSWVSIFSTFWHLRHFLKLKKFGYSYIFGIYIRNFLKLWHFRRITYFLYVYISSVDVWIFRLSFYIFDIFNIGIKNLKIILNIPVQNRERLDFIDNSIHITYRV